MFDSCTSLLVFIDTGGSTKIRCFPACVNAVLYLHEVFCGAEFENSLVTHHQGQKARKQTF